jgi:hypothetical protein
MFLNNILFNFICLFYEVGWIHKTNFTLSTKMTKINLIFNEIIGGKYETMTWQEGEEAYFMMLYEIIRLCNIKIGLLCGAVGPCYSSYKLTNFAVMDEIIIL